MIESRQVAMSTVESYRCRDTKTKALSQKHETFGGPVKERERLEVPRS